jgi:hypothetical protein
MVLRAELMPPALDESLVARLAGLASAIDGAPPGAWEDDLAEFNRLAGTDLKVEEFQGIYGGEEHADFVRRLLYAKQLRPDPAITVAELSEIVRRILSVSDDHDFYLQLFQVNCQHPSKSDLIYWPDQVPELPKDREPTAEEIAKLALSGKA